MDNGLEYSDANLYGDLRTGELVADYYFDDVVVDMKFIYTIRLKSPDQFIITNQEGRKTADEETRQFIIEDLPEWFGPGRFFKTPGGLPKIYEMLQAMNLPIAYATLFQDTLDSLWVAGIREPFGVYGRKKLTKDRKQVIIKALRFAVDVLEAEDSSYPSLPGK